MNKEIFKNYGINTPELSLAGKTMYARVVKVYDGDTITVVLPLFDSFYKYNVRIYGLDTPELRSKNTLLKYCAYRARDRIIELIDGNDLEQIVSLVYIECQEYDKYGRLLCNVYLDETREISITNVLIAEHLGYMYNGEKKLTEEEQIDLLQLI